MGYVGIEEDYYVSVKSVLDITAETGALTTQSRIRELTPADVAPVVHAHWKDNKNGTVSCSRCSTWFKKERVPYLRFCGYCGARMDGERKE